MAVKKYDLALQQFQAALQIDPDSPHLDNNFAWFLANCPDSRFSNPRLAVELGERAVAAVPDEGTFWNTLGVSHYRPGNWQAAVDGAPRGRLTCLETRAWDSTPRSWPWRSGSWDNERKPIANTIP